MKPKPPGYSPEAEGWIRILTVQTVLTVVIESRVILRVTRRIPLIMRTMISLLLLLLISTNALHADELSLSAQKEWVEGTESIEGAEIKTGQVIPTQKTANLLTRLHSFDSKKKAETLRLTQSAIWQNWTPIENLGPSNLNDAPVLLTIGPNNYWMFGVQIIAFKLVNHAYRNQSTPQSAYF